MFRAGAAAGEAGISSGPLRALLHYIGILAIISAFCHPVFSAALNREKFELRGQVILPEGTFHSSARTRLQLTLLCLNTAFTGRAAADSQGRFRFRDLKAGSYILSIYIPDDGEILRTIDITRSFAGPDRKIDKTFRFTENDLRVLLRDAPQSVISARALSVSAKAKREYYEAENRLERDDAEGAIRHLKQAVRLAPQFAEALNHLGTIYFRQQQYVAAERYFREALRQDPRAYEPLVNLGGALLAEGRTQEALAINLHAQNAGPGDPLANAQLGLSYFGAGDYDRALKYLRRAEQLDPGHFSNPQIVIAEIYLRRGQESAAIRELENFLAVHPDSPLGDRVRDTVRKIQTEHSSTVSKQISPF